jgi:hypothetical protein
MGLLGILCLVLFVAWLLGFAVFHIAGGFIHLLLIIILVMVVFRLIAGRGL